MAIRQGRPSPLGEPWTRMSPPASTMKWKTPEFFSASDALSAIKPLAMPSRVAAMPEAWNLISLPWRESRFESTRASASLRSFDQTPIGAFHEIDHRRDGHVEATAGLLVQGAAMLQDLEQFLRRPGKAAIAVQGRQSRPGIKATENADQPVHFLKGEPNGILALGLGRRHDGQTDDGAHEHSFFSGCDQSGGGHGRNHAQCRGQGRTAGEHCHLFQKITAVLSVVPMLHCYAPILCVG